MQLTILLLLVIGVSFGWSLLKKGKIFPIAVVKIEADYQYLSAEALKQTILNDLPASFWTVDLNAIKDHLKMLTWVESVNIEKIWPDTLKIRIQEKKVFMRWGEKGLLSDKEEIFYPDELSVEMKDSLPILYGPEGQVQEVVSQYKNMTQMLQTKKLSGQMLLMSDSGAWFLRLNNGPLLLLGKDDSIKRLARFLRVYDTVFVDNHVARRVDLRYPHGMAISWVEPEKAE